MDPNLESISKPILQSTKDYQYGTHMRSDIETVTRIDTREKLARHDSSNIFPISRTLPSKNVTYVTILNSYFGNSFNLWQSAIPRQIHFCWTLFPDTASRYSLPWSFHEYLEILTLCTVRCSWMYNARLPRHVLFPVKYVRLLGRWY